MTDELSRTVMTEERVEYNTSDELESIMAELEKLKADYAAAIDEIEQLKKNYSILFNKAQMLHTAVNSAAGTLNNASVTLQLLDNQSRARR